MIADGYWLLQSYGPFEVDLEDPDLVDQPEDLPPTSKDLGKALSKHGIPILRWLVGADSSWPAAVQTNLEGDGASPTTRTAAAALAAKLMGLESEKGYGVTAVIEAWDARRSELSDLERV